MKNYTLLSYDFLFSDNHAKLSDKAQLYYIKLMFYADNGFVANPKGILDSMSYDISVLRELINNGDVLTQKGRDEIFITSFFVHNKGVNVASWKMSTFESYWKNLWVKENRIATLREKTKAEKDQEDKNYFDVLERMGVN